MTTPELPPLTNIPGSPRWVEVAQARERILLARIAELEADAERYRWLRHCHVQKFKAATVTFWDDELWEPSTEAELDAAIQAASDWSESEPVEWQCRFAMPCGAVSAWTVGFSSLDRAVEYCTQLTKNGCQAWIRPMHAGDAWEVK